MTSTSACVERERLRERYKAAIRAYRDMITVLDYVLSQREFEETYEVAEKARWEFVRARVALQGHVAEHGCSLLANGASQS